MSDLPEAGAENPRIVVETNDPPVSAQADAHPPSDDAPETLQDAQETPSDDDGESESSADKTEAKKPPQGVQKRIDELTREKHDALRRSDALQTQLDRVLSMLERQSGQGQDQVQQQKQRADTDPPDPEDYDGGDLSREYIRDMARFEARQEFMEQRAAESRRAEVARIGEREKSALERYSDYADVVTADAMAPLLRSSPDVFNLIATHEQGPDVAYYLGKHPEVMSSLAAASPVGAALHLGQIIAELNATKETPKSSPKSPPPAPPTPIRASGAAPVVDIEQQMQDAEDAGDYDAWRILKAKHAKR